VWISDSFEWAETRGYDILISKHTLGLNYQKFLEVPFKQKDLTFQAIGHIEPINKVTGQCCGIGLDPAVPVGCFDRIPTD